MRLNHFISLNSKYSRRQADTLISQGRVKINHTIATQHTKVPNEILDSTKMLKDFRIFIDGQEIKYYKKTQYTAIIYHKPKGELVSKKDSLNRKLIFDSLDSKYSHFMPVGRLDFASEGLLILSDSKEVVRKLMESKLERTYIIKLDSKINNKMIEAMQNGLIIKDSKAGAHRLSKIKEMEFAPMDFQIIKNGNFSKLKVKITEGKNRELRRFFAHFNANILDLRRVSFGFINLNALPVGKVRYFTKEEYKNLHEFLKQKD